MLFVLTGDVQTGKTRWLEKLVASLADRGVVAYGAMAPGVWADRRNDRRHWPNADANGFEKLGIENVLLPQGERVPFARRSDLAAAEGSFGAGAQSARAKLGWHIADEAIGRVNEHFSRVPTMARNARANGLLVVDELGRLELERAEGLTEALAVLDAGPTQALPHALIVVRSALIPHVEGRFSSWGERVFVRPDNAGAHAVRSAFGVND